MLWPGFFYRLFLFYLKPIHQPSVLLRCEAADFFFAAGPLEFSIGQTFVQENETVPFVKERLDPVGPSAAEEKNAVLLRGIEIEFMPNDGGKAIDAAPEIRVPASNVDMFKVGVIQHF